MSAKEKYVENRYERCEQIFLSQNPTGHFSRIFSIYMVRTCKLCRRMSRLPDSRVSHTERETKQFIHFRPCFVRFCHPIRQTNYIVTVINSTSNELMSTLEKQSAVELTPTDKTQYCTHTLTSNVIKTSRRHTNLFIIFHFQWCKRWRK